MLRKCPFTVVSLMKRFAPISLLLLPRASKVNTPSSRPVRASLLRPAASSSRRTGGSARPCDCQFSLLRWFDGKFSRIRRQEHSAPFGRAGGGGGERAALCARA